MRDHLPDSGFHSRFTAKGRFESLWAQSPFGWPFMRKSACSARLRHFGRESMTRTVDEIMELAPVIPVLVIERVEDAQPIATALVASGLPALEVTMRTSVALQVMREMEQVPGAIVGAGTGLNPKHPHQPLDDIGTATWKE